MPELPEVETTVVMLREKTLNKVFVCVWARQKDLQELVGKKIKGVERFGKGIFFYLDDKKVLFVHLRMTGHFLLGKWEEIKNPATGKEEWWSREKIMQDKKNGFLRFVFLLSDGKQLALSDPRKFAKVSLISREEAKKHIAKLGPDPLRIKKKDFIPLFQGRKKAIKTLLMDQFFISGIGNIYAAEILFKAKVNPSRKASSLSEQKVGEIYDLAQTVLKKAIRLRGDSTSDYRLLNGEEGGYQKHHLVYNRKGESCFDCGEKIKRNVVGGRGTYYCPKCQK